MPVWLFPQQLIQASQDVMVVEQAGGGMAIGYPMSEMQILQNTFTEIDANRNGFVDANELCVALARAGHTFVDISLARLLVKLFDSKAIGQIDFTDFLVLNRFLFQMNQVFRANDFNNDGRADPNEMRAMLNMFGFGGISDATLARYMYTVDTDKANVSLEVTEFMHMLCLLLLIHATHAVDGIAHYTMEEFALIALDLRF